MNSLTQTRRRPASVQRVETRLQNIRTNNARFAHLLGIHTAPPVAFILPDADLPDYRPLSDEDAPPEPDEATPEVGAPADLDLIEEWGNGYEVARAQMRDFIDELQAEREMLRAQLKTTGKVGHPSIYGLEDCADMSRIKARLRDLDEMLIFEDDPSQIEANCQ